MHSPEKTQDSFTSLARLSGEVFSVWKDCFSCVEGAVSPVWKDCFSCMEGAVSLVWKGWFLLCRRDGFSGVEGMVSPVSCMEGIDSSNDKVPMEDLKKEQWMLPYQRNASNL